jgi:hypothetical protein
MLKTNVITISHPTGMLIKIIIIIIPTKTTTSLISATTTGLLIVIMPMNLITFHLTVHRKQKKTEITKSLLQTSTKCEFQKRLFVGEMIWIR